MGLQVINLGCKSSKHGDAVQEEINAGLQERLAVAEAGVRQAQSLAEGRAGEAGLLAQQAAELRSQLAEATGKWQEGEVLRRRLHNTIMVQSDCLVRSLHAMTPPQYHHNMLNACRQIASGLRGK